MRGVFGDHERTAGGEAFATVERGATGRCGVFATDRVLMTVGIVEVDDDVPGRLVDVPVNQADVGTTPLSDHPRSSVNSFTS